jgi:predicted O-linked N-acetylglucosamine transferase (SPINDLY family)
MTASQIFGLVPAKPKPEMLQQQVQARFRQALAWQQSGQFEQAQACYQSILKMQPKHYDSQHMLGVVALQIGRFERAQRLIADAIKLNPNDAAAHNNRGYALKQLKRYKEALTSFDRALALRPDFAQAHNNRGDALFDLERWPEALSSFDQALALEPNYTEAHYNRGNALGRLGRYEEALHSFDRALALKPDLAEAHNNRAVTLLDLKALEKALIGFDRALVLKPEYAEAHSNRGFTLCYLRRFAEAVYSYQRALHFDPQLAKAHFGLGLLLLLRNQAQPALEAFDRALALKPNYPEALAGRAQALQELGRFEAALHGFRRALALRPDLDLLFGWYLACKMKICDWSDWEAELAQLQAAIASGAMVCNPFNLLALLDEPELQRMAAEVYAQKNYPRQSMNASWGPLVTAGKIRVGYFSADFHNHATMYLMAELFEAHDRERFEWFAFSFGPQQAGEMRARAQAAFDHFIDVSNMSDAQIAAQSRALGMAIAVDLKGYTKDSHTGIFAHGCAPIQVNYLGYPGTLGADYFDYVLADRTVIPEDCRQHFTEQVVYLPHSYQVNDSRRAISDRVFGRAELGLPEQGFVFCCFNNNYKILPPAFSAWMRILHAVPGSVLWLYEENPASPANLRREAAARGIDPSRLVFAGRMANAEHIARYRLADLFLDTLPYNAHTTASDALWAGLPVLTCSGRSFASRVAASLLNALDLPELITDTWIEFERRAAELALQPEQLETIKRKLTDRCKNTPLFDGQRFARDLERAYDAMIERHQAGLAPAVIEV